LNVIIYVHSTIITYDYILLAYFIFVKKGQLFVTYCSSEKII